MAHGRSDRRRFHHARTGTRARAGEKIEIWELPVEIESVENGRVLFAIVAPPQLDEDGVEGEEDDEAR